MHDDYDPLTDGLADLKYHAKVLTDQINEELERLEHRARRVITSGRGEQKLVADIERLNAAICSVWSAYRLSPRQQKARREFASE